MVSSLLLTTLLSEPLSISDHFVNNCFVSQSIFLVLIFLLNDDLPSVTTFACTKGGHLREH